MWLCFVFTYVCCHITKAISYTFAVLSWHYAAFTDVFALLISTEQLRLIQIIQAELDQLRSLVALLCTSILLGVSSNSTDSFALLGQNQTQNGLHKAAHAKDSMDTMLS